MASDDALLTRIRRAIVKAIEPKVVPPEVEEQKDSLTGTAIGALMLDDLTNAFTRPSTDLEAVFDDMRDMDDSLVEVSTALDVLSEDAMAPDPTQELPFRFVFDGEDSAAEEILGLLVRRIGLPDLLIEIAREGLLMGNEFRQIGISNQNQVARLMYMAPETIRKQTTEQGVLLTGGDDDTKPDGWAYVQYVNESFVAGFYPWEVGHTWWARRGGSLYGAPLFQTARWPWRKLVAIEDALALNWLTRAFARLLFKLDVTGKSSVEAEAAIKEFQHKLNMARVGAGKNTQSALSLVRDIFIGTGYHELAAGVHAGLADVEVLDTAGSAFERIEPVEYYRSKIIMASRVPPAYLGLEEGVNAKATLMMEDRKYAKTLQTVQTVVGRTISYIGALELLLHDMSPQEHPFWIVWYNPSRADVVDVSLAQQQFASSDRIFMDMGVVDPEYVATKHVGMTAAEWSRVANRIQKQVQDRGGEDVG